MRRFEEKRRLTDQEKTVIRSIFEGLSDEEIADRIHISERAAGASVRQLYYKLAVRTRSQLVTVALAQYRDQLEALRAFTFKPNREPISASHGELGSRI